MHSVGVRCLERFVYFIRFLVDVKDLYIKVYMGVIKN